MERSLVESVRFGIIGCGAAAAFHTSGFEGIRDSKVSFVAAHDIDEEALDDFARTQNVVPYRSLGELLESDIDSVLILLPHYLHASVTKEAAKAGKHVLCEKPMAITLEECDEMIEATRKAGVKLMIAENHRFLPAHQLIKNFVERGFVGNVFLGRTYEGAFTDPNDFLDPEIWHFTYAKGGGGVLMDQGPHKFAMLNWILDSQVESAQCWLSKALPSPASKGEDSAAILLRYENGAMMDVVVSSSAVHPPNNVTEFHGTKGTILEDHSWEKPVKVLSSHPEAEKQGEYFSPEVEHGPFPKYYPISARVEDTYFADCILHDRKPEFTPEQAKEAIAVVLLSYLAAKKRGAVTMDQLKEHVRRHGSRSVMEGMDEAVQRNYQHLRW